MTGYCVSDIAAITGGVLSGDGAALVTGVVIDSRCLLYTSDAADE